MAGDSRNNDRKNRWGLRLVSDPAAPEADLASHGRQTTSTIAFDDRRVAVDHEVPLENTCEVPAEREVRMRTPLYLRLDMGAADYSVRCEKLAMVCERIAEGRYETGDALRVIARKLLENGELRS